MPWIGWQRTKATSPKSSSSFAPLRPSAASGHIDQAVYRLLERPEADAVRTVCMPFQNPFKMWRIDPDGLMQPLLETEYPEPYNMPRQLLPEVYWQTGYVDAAWATPSWTKNSMTGEHILPLVIDPSEWIDIDSPDDWRRAERLLESGEITFEDLGFQIFESESNRKLRRSQCP